MDQVTSWKLMMGYLFGNVSMKLKNFIFKKNLFYFSKMKSFFHVIIDPGCQCLKILKHQTLASRGPGWMRWKLLLGKTHRNWWGRTGWWIYCLFNSNDIFLFLYFWIVLVNSCWARRDRYEKHLLYWAETAVKGNHKPLVKISWSFLASIMIPETFDSWYPSNL